MAYIPAWQQLSDAIENVMMGVGRSREEAQSDICRAIADRTVKIQGKLKKHTTRVVTSTRVLRARTLRYRRKSNRQPSTGRRLAR